MASFKHGNECVCSYTICVILDALTIIFGIGAYFTYKYMNHVKKLLLKKVLIIKQHLLIELINGTSQRNKHQKLSKYCQ